MLGFGLFKWIYVRGTVIFLCHDDQVDSTSMTILRFFVWWYPDHVSRNSATPLLRSWSLGWPIILHLDNLSKLTISPNDKLYLLLTMCLLHFGACQPI